MIWEGPPRTSSTSHPTSKSGQSVTECEGGCRCPVLAASFIEDMGEVIGHGFFGEAESLGDLAISFALGDELEHLDLALGQVGRKNRAREGAG